MAAVLCREWVPYSKEAVVKKQKAVAPSHFDTHASKRTLHKLSVQLTRAQAETEETVKVLERTVKQLGDSNAKCKATEFLIEKLRATMAKLQVKLLGSPKLRQALSEAHAATARADASEEQLREATKLLNAAVDNSHKAEKEYQNECEVHPLTAANTVLTCWLLCQAYLRRVGVLRTELAKATNRATTAQALSTSYKEKYERMKEECVQERQKRLVAEAQVVTSTFFAVQF